MLMSGEGAVLPILVQWGNNFIWFASRNYLGKGRQRHMMGVMSICGGASDHDTHEKGHLMACRDNSDEYLGLTNSPPPVF